MPVLNLTQDQIFGVYWSGGTWSPGFQRVGRRGASPSVGFSSHFTLGVSIPAGSIINSGTFTIDSDPFSNNTPTFYIKAELAADPDTFANAAAYMARRGLTNVPSVVDAGLVTLALIDLTENWGGGDYAKDVTAILQELVNVFSLTKVVIFCDDHNGRTTGDKFNTSTTAYLDIDYTPFVPVIPVATTQAATSVDKTVAILNGTGVTLNDTVFTEEGFVYGNISHGDPGDVPPAASGYSNWATIVGSFGLGAFNGGVSGLLPGTDYYYRAFVKNDNGPGHYAYGAEVTFHTWAANTFYLIGNTVSGVGTVLWVDGTMTTGGLDSGGVCPFPCRLSNFRVHLTSNPLGVGEHRTFQLQRNRVSTGVTLVFNFGDLYKEDLTTVITTVAGDYFEWWDVLGDTFIGAANVFWSIEVNPLYTDTFPLLSGTFRVQNGFTQYVSLDGGYQATMDPTQTPMPCDGKLKRFHVWADSLALGAKSWVMTLYKNGAPTAVVATITGASLTWADDTTEINFVAGDLFCWVSNLGLVLDFYGKIGVSIEIPGGGIPRLRPRRLVLQNADVRYSDVHLVYSFQEWDGLAAPIIPTTPVRLSASNLCLSLDTAPGVGKYWELELLVNGNPTGFKARCSNAEILKVVTGAFPVPVNAAPSFKLTPGNSPALGFIGASLLLGPGVSITTLPKSQISRVPRVQSIVSSC